MKRCPKCDETKALDAFYRDRTRSDGRQGICRDCRTAHRQQPETRAYHAQYREANREVLTERDRVRYWDDAETHRQQNREYAAAHRAEAVERARQWAAANPHRAERNRRAWEERHPVRAREVKKTTSQRRRGAAPTEAAREYMRTCLLHDPCAYCGAPMEHVDHIVPLALGGLSEWDNLTAACGDCNVRKHSNSLLHFLLRS